MGVLQRRGCVGKRALLHVLLCCSHLLDWAVRWDYKLQDGLVSFSHANGLSNDILLLLLKPRGQSEGRENPSPLELSVGPHSRPLSRSVQTFVADIRRAAGCRAIMRVGAACKAQAPRAPSRVAPRCTASLPENLWTAARPPLRHSCCRRDAAASARRFKAVSVQALSRPQAGYEREAAFCP